MDSIFLLPTFTFTFRGRGKRAAISLQPSLHIVGPKQRHVNQSCLYLEQVFFDNPNCIFCILFACVLCHVAPREILQDFSIETK